MQGGLKSREPNSHLNNENITYASVESTSVYAAITLRIF